MTENIQNDPNTEPASPHHRVIARGAIALAAVASSLIGVGHEASASSEPAPTEVTAVAPGTDTGVSEHATVKEGFTVADKEEYARNFSQDPEAGVLTEPNSPEANAELIAGQLHGKKIESISVQGSASAEDDGPDAGVTSPSLKNLELADKRAEVFTPELEDALAQASISHPKIQELAPVEDSWSQGEVATATALAEQFGYQDYASMIDAYNVDSSKVPPDVAVFLNETLLSHRDVGVEVILDQNQNADATGTPTNGNDKSPSNPTPPKESSETTMNHIAGYIPKQHVTQPGLPPEIPTPPNPNPTRNNLHSQRNAPQKFGQFTQAHSFKQPIAPSYNPGRFGNKRNKSLHENRRGKGRS